MEVGGRPRKSQDSNLPQITPADLWHIWRLTPRLVRSSMEPEGYAKCAEQGLREPTGPAKALLVAIGRDPTTY